MLGEVFGSYRVTERLAAGGIGEVYIGEHQLIGRRAAIKVLQPHVSQKPRMVQRFFQEAKATAAIGNPGIVEIFDFGFRDDGRAYLVMEFLTGEPLSARLKRQRILPTAQVLAMMGNVCDALGAAHALGIVHRDLKPDNIFLARDTAVRFGERPKLLDFGLVKLQYDTDNPLKTGTGVLMGTPAYMAPEQCRGAGGVDARADLYALGCILFEMLCGQRPFTGAGPGDYIGMHLYKEPPRPSLIRPGLPIELETLILHLLVKRPEERIQTTDELRGRLDAVARILDAQDPEDAETTLMARARPAVSTAEPDAPPSTLAPSAPSGAADARPAPETAPGGGEARGAMWTPVESSSAVRGEAAVSTATTRKSHAPVLLGGLAAIALAVALVWMSQSRSGATDGATETTGPSTAPVSDNRSVNTASDATANAPPDDSPAPSANVPASAAPVVATEAASDEPPGGQDPADAPEMVELTIRSTPAGAAVHLSGSREALGVTPYTHRIEQSDAEVAFEVRRRGYHTRRLTLSAGASASQQVALKPRKRKPRATRKPKADGTDIPDDVY